MTKYIERDKAVKLIFLAADTGRAAKALSLLGKESVADVAPVVHGEWLSGRTFLENAVCSNCKTTYEAYYSKYQYCPRCGAKMDRGESGD